MSAPARWDIVVVPFPYIDRAYEKKRPALIISDARFHKAFGTCWAMMITGAKKSSWPCDIPIEPRKTTGLPLPCVIRPAKLAATDTGHIIRKLGTIGAAERLRVEAFLKDYFDFSA